MIKIEGPAGAKFSDDKSCRFYLWRQWNNSVRMLRFIGLNPSRADGLYTDNTIRKVCAIAKYNGYGGIIMLNLYAFITPYPEMLDTDKSELATNDLVIRTLCKNEHVVFSWGAFKEAKQRLPEIIKICHEVNATAFCLHKTPDGIFKTKHPLYCKNQSTLYLLPEFENKPTTI